MKVDPVRRLALDTIIEIERGRPLETSLAEALAELSDPEKQRGAGLLAELVKGSVQWRARYDHLIAHFCRRRPPRDGRVLALLRMTLHQLIACAGIPTYAAIHQAGQICRQRISRHQVTFINGLLQSMARFLEQAGTDPTQAIKALFPDPDQDAIGWLEKYYSFPRWLVERWHDQFGFTLCETICQANNRIPEVTVHVLPPADPGRVAQQLAAQGFPTRRGSLQERGLVLTERCDRKRLTELLAEHPELIVQDEAVQDATAWLAQEATGRLLDMCAAPGGKTFFLHARQQPSTLTVAADCSHSRLATLIENAKRIEISPLSVVLAEGRCLPFAPASFNTVLLDGPCSGTGVLRHHPEGRWRLDPGTATANGQILLELARSALGLLQPGGRLWFATCSLEPEENEMVIATLLRERDDLEPDPAASVGRGCECTDVLADTGSTGYHRRWFPAANGTDGFYAARLRLKGYSE